MKMKIKIIRINKINIMFMIIQMNMIIIINIKTIIKMMMIIIMIKMIIKILILLNFDQRYFNFFNLNENILKQLKFIKIKVIMIKL